MRVPSWSRPVLPALALLAGLACAAYADAASVQEDFRWTGALRAGQRVEVKGVHGAIHAEPASGNEVEVVAVKRRGREGRVEDVRIERVMHDEGVTICAVYPSDGRRPNRCTAGDEWSSNVQDNDVSVEFTVRVPRGVHLYAATVNGAVRADDMPADVQASSVNGAVRVSAAGVVEASTVNGNVDATTGRANPGRDLELKSVNGTIRLRVPAGFRATVEAELLNGDIESDFPIEIHRNRYVGQNAHGQIGGGGSRLRLETVNGNIEIRRAGGR